MTKKGTDIKMVSIREPAAAIHYIYRFREKTAGSKGKKKSVWQKSQVKDN